MANPLRSVKNRIALRTRTKRVLLRKGSEYIVLESVVSLVFFALAFFVFLPLLNRDSDLLRMLIVLYGFFVVLWGFSTIYDYLVKSSRLLANNAIRNYSLIAGLNAVVGLALPIFILNSVVSIIVHTLAAMQNWGTAFCEIRLSFVNFYNASNIYNQVSSLTFWVLVFALGLIILGGLFERVNRK